MSATIEHLRSLNAKFIENFVTNDVTAHDALLHPEFLFIRSDGARIDRATYLKAWATGFDPAIIVYWDVRDELITVIGDVALVRATNKQIVGDTASMSTYTDTYLLQNGRWTCIQAQISPVAAAQEPDDTTIIIVYRNGVIQASTG